MINTCDVCGCEILQHKERFFGRIDRKTKDEVVHYEEFQQCAACGNIVRGSTRLIEKNRGV